MSHIYEQKKYNYVISSISANSIALHMQTTCWWNKMNLRLGPLCATIFATLVIHSWLYVATLSFHLKKSSDDQTATPHIIHVGDISGGEG